MLRSFAVLFAVGLMAVGCSSSAEPTPDESSEDVVSAFVTCTPADPAKASFGGSIVWSKLWIRKNAKGEPNITFRVRRNTAPAKNEVWSTYEDSPVNEVTKTSQQIHVVLGEDVTYTLHASRSEASAPYAGTLETSEDFSFAVSCQ